MVGSRLPGGTFRRLRFDRLFGRGGAYTRGMIHAVVGNIHSIVLIYSRILGIRRLFVTNDNF